MNSQLTNSLMQARQFELQRGAEKARIVGAIPDRAHPVTRMLRAILAPRPNLRAPRTEAAGWNAVNQA